MNKSIHDYTNIPKALNEPLYLDDPDISGMMSAWEGWTQASPNSSTKTGLESLERSTLPSS